jgi:uncharacterized protein YfeS
MTKEEYVEICDKYSAYLVGGAFKNCYYINYGKGQRIAAAFQVTFFDSDDVDGFGEVYPHCYDDGNDIVSALEPFYKTKDKKQFEKYILVYIKNFKKSMVDLKKEEISKDFV